MTESLVYLQRKMLCRVQELVPRLARPAAISHHVATAIIARYFLGLVGPNARQILPNCCFWRQVLKATSAISFDTSGCTKLVTQVIAHGIDERSMVFCNLL